MGKAFLVVGPEGSGTRWVTSLFIAAGCFGDAGHEQRLDIGIPAGEQLLVWRRSIPHNKVYPNLEKLRVCLQEAGYTKVIPIVTTRDWFSVEKSQIRMGYAADVDAAYWNIFKAYNIVYEACGPYQFVYEAAMLYRRKYVDNFMSQFDLSIPADKEIAFINGDDKYYD